MQATCERNKTLKIWQLEVGWREAEVDWCNKVERQRDNEITKSKKLFWGESSTK